MNVIALAAETDENRPILKFLDLEGLLELIENGCLMFRRWEGEPGDGSASSFLHERLPEALLRVAARDRSRVRGRLQRWWAAKEREAEMQSVLDQVREFRLPDAAAWIDDWHETDGCDPILWRLHETGGRTVAVLATVAGLRRALHPEPGETVLLEVVDYRPVGGTAIHPALRDAPHLAFERRMRALLAVADPTRFARDRAVAVDTGPLIRGVYLSPAASDRRRDLVRHLLERANFSVPCSRIDFARAPYPQLPAVVART
jgi:hypothetical protein